VVLTPDRSLPLSGKENQPYVAPVSSDIYNWNKRYASAIRRLKQDAAISEANRSMIISFLESREARGLSIARVVEYANHLIVVGRLIAKNFDSMNAEDLRQLLLKLKKREKENKGWVRTKGYMYSEHTLSHTKSMLKVFWRWMKGLGLPVAAYTSAILEFFGGIFPVIGLIVPIVALFLAIEMISTSILRKSKMKAKYVGGYETDFL
jgi:hypothetical protein